MEFRNLNNKINDIKSKFDKLIDEAMEVKAEAELDEAQMIIDTLCNLESGVTEDNISGIEDFMHFYKISVPNGQSSIITYILREHSLRELKTMLDSYFKYKDSVKEPKTTVTIKAPTVKFEVPNKNHTVYSEPVIAALDINKEKDILHQYYRIYYRFIDINDLRQGDIIMMHTDFETIDLIIVNPCYLTDLVIAFNKQKEFIYIFDKNEDFRYENLYFTKVDNIKSFPGSINSFKEILQIEDIIISNNNTSGYTKIIMGTYSQSINERIVQAYVSKINEDYEDYN